jgi:hypothetical protein
MAMTNSATKTAQRAPTALEPEPRVTRHLLPGGGYVDMPEKQDPLTKLFGKVGSLLGSVSFLKKAFHRNGNGSAATPDTQVAAPLEAGSESPQEDKIEIGTRVVLTIDAGTWKAGQFAILLRDGDYNAVTLRCYDGNKVHAGSPDAIKKDPRNSFDLRTTRDKMRRDDSDKQSDLLPYMGDNVNGAVAQEQEETIRVGGLVALTTPIYNRSGEICWDIDKLFVVHIIGKNYVTVKYYPDDVNEKTSPEIQRRNFFQVITDMEHLRPVRPLARGMMFPHKRDTDPRNWYKAPVPTTPETTIPLPP